MKGREVEDVTVTSLEVDKSSEVARVTIGGSSGVVGVIVVVVDVVGDLVVVILCLVLVVLGR